jgi:hypothetical protein
VDKKTLALALGEEVPEGSDEELDEASDEAPESDAADALADDLELAFDPQSDPVTRAEAFRRAVKAAMR